MFQGVGVSVPATSHSLFFVFFFCGYFSTRFRMEHACGSCMASLEPEDGHDRCGPCLGLDHLREAITDQACINCSIMPRSVRLARLAQLDPLSYLPSFQSGGTDSCRDAAQKRSASRGEAPAGKRRRKADDQLSSKVDRLASDMEEMKALLLSLQPAGGMPRAAAVATQGSPLPVDDAISIAASSSQFNDFEQVGLTTPSAAGSSHSSASGSRRSSEDSSMGAIIRAALARLQLDTPTEGKAPSAFYRRNPPPAKTVVPPSPDFLKELHSCWADTSAFTRPGSDERALAAMEGAEAVGLLHMPAVEPAIAALIVSPDEAMKPDPRCPSAQCKVTDDYVCRAYATAARIGRLGNTLSHFLLALSTSLQEAQVDASVRDICDASLQTFACQTRELGRLMSTLVHTRRHVWLAQSPLTEATRRVLRRVPAAPGELFGSAALDALDRTAEADETRRRLAGLHKRTPTSSRPRAFPSAPPPSRPPQMPPQAGRRPSRRDTKKPTGDFRSAVRRSPRQQQASKPDRRSSGSFGARGQRR